jgi:hypothetical protein
MVKEVNLFWRKGKGLTRSGWVYSVLSLLLLVSYTACRPDATTNIPDVSDIDVDLKITRFEQELLADTNIDAAGIQRLRENYPAFSQVYFDHVMPGADNIAAQTDPELKFKDMQTWIRHPRTRWVYDTVQQIFPDLAEYEKGLEESFRYAKYYFPEKQTPRVFTTVSDFGYFPFIYAEDTLQDGIGVSLEMFLGETFPYRKYNGLSNAFSDYLIRSYNKDHMVKRTMEVWIDDMAAQPQGNRLLDLMIHNGKKLYILQSLLPETPDTVIMEYPAEKMQYVKEHEREIWLLFTSENWLYETSLNKIQKYIGPSPTSPGMPADAPGNTGSWMGWQIVKAYMAKHPETTFQALLGMNDAQALLDASGYKPPR